jgi:hypothetical protein
MFCCDLFESLIENAGKSGFSVVAVSKMNLQSFFLQSRTQDEAFIHQLDGEPVAGSSSQVASSSTIQRGIRFCPFCGINLTLWINENEEIFATLILSNRELLLGDL